MRQKTALILLLTVIIILTTLTIIIRHQQNDEHMIKEIIVHPPYTSSEAKGKQYTEVIQAYQNAGFTNISFEKIDDLIFGWLTEDGEVEKVEIDGNTEYTIETAYKQNEAKAVVYYHTFPEKTDTTDNNTSNDEIIKDSTNGDAENTEIMSDDLIDKNNTPEQIETDTEEENIESNNHFKIYAEDTISTMWDKGLRYGDTIEIQGKLHGTKDGDYYIGYAYSDVEIAIIPNKNIIYVDNYETLSYIEFEEKVYNSKSHKGVDKCKFCKVIGTLSNNHILENVSLYFDDISYEYEIDADELINECIVATEDQIHIDLPFSDVNKYNYKWIRIRGYITEANKKEYGKHQYISMISSTKNDDIQLYISGNFKTGEYIDTIAFCGIGTHQRNTINLYTDIQEQ